MQNRGGILSVRLDEVTVDDSEPFSQLDLSVGQYLRLTVSDTGVGISPAICSRIFDPYFTTKEKDKGTGLGLAVVHGIVKRHNGDIVVKSQPHAGTQFDVYLPVSDDAMEDNLAGDMALPQGSERVLLIDDENDLIQIGKAMLQRLGYNVNGIVGSSTGLEVFKKDPFAYDVVISDYNMPGMKGDRLAREMLAIRLDIPIIICTGFTERLNEETMRESGVRKILMKPMSLSDMSKGIREVLHLV